MAAKPPSVDREALLYLVGEQAAEIDALKAELDQWRYCRECGSRDVTLEECHACGATDDA